MAQIEGLKEQQDALKRIKNNLAKIGDINEFLKNVSDLSKNTGLQAAYSVSISFSSGDDKKKFKCPLLVSDNQYILDAAQKYKETIVEQVKKDAAEFRITLSPKETAALDWAPVFN